MQVHYSMFQNTATRMRIDDRKNDYFFCFFIDDFSICNAL